MNISTTPNLSVNPWHAASLARINPVVQPYQHNPGADFNRSVEPGTQNPPSQNNTEKKDDVTSSSESIPASKTAGDRPLTEEELKIVQNLKQKDAEVKNHEMAHIAAGGNHIISGAHFEYQRGPDGINYAVAGEVSIDTSPVPGDPKATLNKMHTIQNAALAPLSPSSQDRKVASQAASLAAKAQSELMILLSKERFTSDKERLHVNQQTVFNAYAPENGTDNATRGELNITI